MPKLKEGRVAMTPAERQAKRRREIKADPRRYENEKKLEAERSRLRRQAARDDPDEERQKQRREYERLKKQAQRAAKRAQELEKRRGIVPEKTPCVDLSEKAPAPKATKSVQKVLMPVKLFGSRHSRIKKSKVDLITVDVDVPSSPEAVPLDNSPPTSQPVPAAVRCLDIDKMIITPSERRAARTPRGPVPGGAALSSLRSILRPRSKQADVSMTEVSGPMHSQGYATPNFQVDGQRLAEIRSMPRVYDRVKESLRNQRRKYVAWAKKKDYMHAMELKAARRNHRHTNTFEKSIEVITDKVTRLMTSHQRKNLLDKVVSPTKVKRNRCASSFGRIFSLSRKTVVRKKVGRRDQKKLIARRTLRVLCFLQDPQWSVTYPGKKDMVSCRYEMDVDGKKKSWRKHIPKVVLTENIRDLHLVYNQHNPDLKVNLTFFKDVRRRSQFIKCLSHAKAEVCLCQKHQNFAMKMRSLHKYTKMPTNPDKLVREYTPQAFERALSEFKPSLPNVIMYDEWKLKPVPIQDPKEKKVVKKLRPCRVEVPREKFVKAMVQAFPGIKFHVELANHQHKTVRNQRHNLKEDEECTIQMDFAQNWLVGFGEEVQSAFYAKDPITVHPAVIHIRVGGQLLAISLCLATDDRRHDAASVFAMVDKIIEWVKKNYPKIRMIHFWSDSPSSQYRNISIFSLICRHVELHGIECTWSYFESGHGKGPCDGVGAAAKKKAERFIKAGGNIACAAEFVQHCSKEGTIHYLLVEVTKSYYFRDLITWFVTPRKVKGTMTVHDVMLGQRSISILVRQMFCYEACCWDAHELRPVIPQRRCDSSHLALWTSFELYNDKILKKLDQKKSDFEKNVAIQDKQDKEAAEKEANVRNSAIEKYAIGEYVAAMWGDIWWIGVVQYTMEMDDYAVRFMHPVDGSHVDECQIDWPEEEDITAIPHADILCVVSKPVASIYKQKWCFTLPSKEVKNIKNRFDNMC